MCLGGDPTVSWVDFDILPDVSQPLFTKCAHAFQDRKERMPLPGQAVLNTRRNLGKASAADHLGLFQAPQPVGERLGADPVQRTLQLTEAAATRLQISHNERCPAIPDQDGRAGNWTANFFGGWH